MSESIKEKAKAQKIGTRRPLIIAGVVVIILILITPFGYLAAMNGRIMPGISVNGLTLGGLAKDAAAAKLNAAIITYENNGLNFTNGKKTMKVDATQVPDGAPDAGHQILNIDTDAGLAAAYSIGHVGNIFDRLEQAADVLVNGRRITMPYTIDRDGFKNALRLAWSGDEIAVQDARITITMNGDTLSSTSVIPDAAGFEYDYDRAVSDIKTKLPTLDSTPITLELARIGPAIKTAAAETVVPLVPQALALAPLSLSADELKWTLAAHELAPMLTIEIKPDGTPSLGIDYDAAQIYFKQLAADYDIAPTPTSYEIDPATNKMLSFNPGNDGRKIDIDATVAALEKALALQLAGADGKKAFNIVTVAAKTQIITQSGAELGINQVVGVGQSDFSGSSTNRIKNIEHGSNKLNGHLIAPGEEFSAINVLDPVTLEDGYFQEQIILGDKIEQAVGGGLCQIGTTLFRMAMNSGLPITERQNHSLVVHYYSDPTNGNPGTDATLYGPHPDLRFVNNTGHWLLITTAINVKTKKLTYTLWGTPDGRHGSYTPPQVLNWIPAPTDIQQVDDPTLPVGMQKCQNPFQGANTTFTYTIANADGTVTTRNFTSHYRALPKICANGTGIPGTILSDGNVVPPAPKIAVPNPLANISAPINNINIPPEAAMGN
jgi:vancomycin resistance protein YoaR